MHLSPPFLSLPLALLPFILPLTSATPLASSKHNLHLATCTPLPSCLLIICSTPVPYTAAAYYPNGASASAQPGEIGTVADPAAPWEGVARRATLRAGVVTANIAKGAKALAKGEIAGEASLGAEGFVCFRDGVGRFSVQGGEVNCVVDYWCAATG